MKSPYPQSEVSDAKSEMNKLRIKPSALKREISPERKLQLIRQAQYMRFAKLMKARGFCLEPLVIGISAFVLGVVAGTICFRYILFAKCEAFKTECINACLHDIANERESSDLLVEKVKRVIASHYADDKYLSRDEVDFLLRNK